MKIKDIKVKSIRVGLVLALVCAMFVVGMMPHPTIQNDDKGWHVVWEGSLSDYVYAAEANPGAGVSGILEIFIINHTASPDTAYDENSSSDMESWCTAAGLGYCNADDSNIDIAHTTDFDIVVRVRGNQTICHDGSQFMDSYLRVRITSADLSIGADTEMTGVVSQNSSGNTYLWMNFYEDNSGSGYSISRDETAEITSIKFEAYY